MTHSVYAFREIGSAEMRYVGQTKRTGAFRFAFQRSIARTAPRQTPFTVWLQGEVEVVLLAECISEAEAREAERSVIKLCSAMGHRLFNVQHVPSSMRSAAA